MLNEKIIKKLNSHLNSELYTANLYLQISAWCYCNGFEGTSNFFQNQSKEEMNHMRRMFYYLVNSNHIPLISSINISSTNFSSIIEVLNFAYDHECNISKKINNLIHVSINLEDYSTVHFLQWYINEQYEEEKILKSILNKFLLAKNSLSTSIFIDHMLKSNNIKNITNNSL